MFLQLHFRGRIAQGKPKFSAYNAILRGFLELITSQLKLVVFKELVILGEARETLGGSG